MKCDLCEEDAVCTCTRVWHDGTEDKDLFFCAIHAMDDPDGVWTMIHKEKV